MEYSYRKLNQARLSILTLESRVTPGSLLTSSLAVSGLEPILSRPVARGADNFAIARQIEDTTLQNVVGAMSTPAGVAQASEVQITSPSTPVNHGNLQISTINHAPQSVHNPAMSAPAVASQASRMVSAPVTGTANAQNDILTASAKTKQHVMPTMTRHSIMDAVQTGAPATSVTTPCRPDSSKVFTLEWNSYQGGGGVDAVNDVGAGKAGNTGTTYAAGYTGADGVISTYSDAGACGITVTEPDSKFTGIAINTKGVYATYDKNDGSESGIIQFNGALVEQARAFVTNPGVAIEFNGVGISPNGANPDVYVAGRYNDGTTYSLGVELRLEDDLSAAVYFNIVDYGGDGETQGVAADRPNNAYFGGRFDGFSVGVGDVPLTYRLNSDGATAPWAFYWSDGVTVQYDSRIGVRGAKFVGGTSSAGGIYFGGTLDNEALVPATYVTSLWLKLNEIDGSVGLEEWAINAYSGDLGNLGTNDVAADRGAGLGNANANYGSYRSNDAIDGTLNKGRVYRWDLLLATTAYQYNLGVATDGFNYEVNGVDVRTTSPTDNVLFGGLTNATALPSAVGCDLTYGGAVDGMVLSLTQ